MPIESAMRMQLEIPMVALNIGTVRADVLTDGSFHSDMRMYIYVYLAILSSQCTKKDPEVTAENLHYKYLLVSMMQCQKNRLLFA